LIDSDPVAEAAGELRELRRDLFELRRANEPIPPELTEREQELREIISGAGRRSSREDPERREEYEALRDDIRDMRAAGLEVPPELTERERELRDELYGRRRGSDRRRGSSRSVDPEIRAEYEETRRDIRELRNAGREVPPELEAYERELRDEIYGRRGRSDRDVDPDLIEERDALKRDMDDLRRARQPVPPDLQQRYAEVQRLVSEQQGGRRQSNRRSTGNRRERELESLIRRIEALEARGDPVPESLLERAEMLEIELDGAEPAPDQREPRKSRASVERDLDNLVRQIETLQSQGRAVPESLFRKAEALDDQLTRGDLEEPSPDQPGNPAAAPEDRKSDRRPPSSGGRDRAASGRSDRELAQVERMIEQLESTGRPVPEHLLKRRDGLMGPPEPGSEVVEASEPASPPAAGPPEPASPQSPHDAARARAMARAQKVRDQIARGVGQGPPVDNKTDEQSAEMERRLTEAIGQSPPPPADAASPKAAPPKAAPRKAEPPKAAPPTVAPPKAASPKAAPPQTPTADEEHRRAVEKLEKMHRVMRQFESIDEPVPHRLRLAAERLEQRLARSSGEESTTSEAESNGPDAEAESARRRRDREQVVRLEAKLQGVEESIAELRKAKKGVPAKLTATATTLRRQLEAAKRRVEKNRPTVGKKPHSDKDAVPFEKWGAYVEDLAARYDFDDVQRAAATKIVGGYQDRVKAGRQSGAGVQAGGAPSPEEQKLAQSLFAELRRRVEYLIKPSQRAAAEAAAKAVTSAPAKKPSFGNSKKQADRK